MASTLTQKETGRVVSESGSRFWVCDLNYFDHGDTVGIFGSTTVGIVDELAGGIVAYASEENAEAIISALRNTLGEV